MTEAPDTGALDLDLAASKSDDPFIRASRAAVLQRAGRMEQAAHDWTLALRRDPEIPEAYLGRARCYLALKPPSWDLALADLEHASSWAQNDPRLELRILATYARCLAERPDRSARWLALFRRAAGHAWHRSSDVVRPVVDLALRLL